MLHTQTPLAGGSPHNGLQIIHFVRRTLKDASLFIHFLQPFSHRTPRALLPKLTSIILLYFQTLPLFII
jgi:hypothetical protein